jgi:hypothetical protein
MSNSEIVSNVPQPRNESEVQVEDVHQPLNGGSRLVGQNLDQVWPRLVSRRLECVIVELLDAVANLLVDLCPCESTVDSRCGLGGVASHEVVLVKENDISTSKVDGVSSAQAGHCRRG